MLSFRKSEVSSSSEAELIWAYGRRKRRHLTLDTYLFILPQLFFFACFLLFYAQKQSADGIVVIAM